MESKTSWTETFREARRKRRAEKAVLQSVDETEMSDEVVTKEERDRLLMPPPTPKSKRPKPDVGEALSETTLESPFLQSKVPSEFTEMESGSNVDSIPQDFFEEENRRAKEKLERERLIQKTDSEYLRFMKEIEAPLDAMAEEDAAEEEESERRREEREEIEQRKNAERIQKLKGKRQVRFSSNQRPTPSQDSLEETSLSSDEDDPEQWREKAI